MGFSFENHGNSTYLVYQITDEDQLDSLSLGMVTNNRIKGVAPILYTQMDEARFLKYNVTANVPVSKFFTGAVTKNRLIGVFTGIADAMQAAEEYMIDTSMFLFDLDYIFVDVTSCETQMICLPIMSNEAAHVDLAAFFKNIVFSAQYDQTENTDYVAKIVSYLNGTAFFSLSDFGNILKKIGTEASQDGGVQPAAPKSMPQQPVAPQPTPQQPGVAPVVPQSQPVPPMQPPVPPVQAAPPRAQPVAPAPKPMPAQQGFVVPGSAPQPAVPQNAPPTPPPPEGEKRISMLHLLMHYDKKTKAAYDEQKKRDKQAKAAGTPTTPPGQAKGNPPPPPAGGFAVPGTQTAMPPAAPQPQPPAAKPQPTVPQPPVQMHQNPPQPMQPSVMPGTGSANFGATTVLSNASAGATTVLGIDPASPSSMPHLVRTKNNERINLNKPTFRIGKEKSFVDYFIGDNTAISRSHAEFTIRDGEYFVTDTNSTNHTFVNGAMIQSSVEVKLTHGTKIKLANEEFEFRLY